MDYTKFGSTVLIDQAFKPSKKINIKKIDEQIKLWEGLTKCLTN